MHVVCVNYAYNRAVAAPDTLLDHYETLTGWADAASSAGARVSVVQRFHEDRDVTRNGVLYRLVRAPAAKFGGISDWPLRLHRAVADLTPDLVHVNGLQFARQAWQLKWSLRNRRSDPASRIPILLQDHANTPPRQWFSRWTLSAALRRMDAVSFVSRDQAAPWKAGGFLSSRQPVFELMEGSSRFHVESRIAARLRTGLIGDPVCLWVGRLNSNKDPISVLRGFGRALPAMPNARLAMVYGAADLLAPVQAWLAENTQVAARVTLLGHLPHAELEALYNSADFFILGSHREGSGYAVLEALACGVVPLLTDIPSFRVLSGQGTVGGLWPVGDPGVLADVLAARYLRLMPETPQQVRAFFDANFCWQAIGTRALAVYRQIAPR